MILQLEQFAEVLDDSFARKSWWTEVLWAEGEREANDTDDRQGLELPGYESHSFLKG